MYLCKSNSWCSRSQLLMDFGGASRMATATARATATLWCHLIFAKQTSQRQSLKHAAHLHTQAYAQKHTNTGGDATPRSLLASCCRPSSRRHRSRHCLRVASIQVWISSNFRRKHFWHSLYVNLAITYTLTTKCFCCWGVVLPAVMPRLLVCCVCVCVCGEYVLVIVRHFFDCYDVEVECKDSGRLAKKSKGAWREGGGKKEKKEYRRGTVYMATITVWNMLI